MEAKVIIFCGNGGSWIRPDAKKLCKRLGIDRSKIFEVLDYTHAIQNLNEIIGYIPKKARDRKKLVRAMRDKLWQGDVEEIKHLIDDNLKTRQKNKALKKWQNYFDLLLCTGFF